MSYFEDYVEDGLCCECCGGFLGGDEPGFVRRCAGCQPKTPPRERNTLPRFNRYAIKDNPKVQQPSDPRRQGSKMSCPFCVARVKVVGFGDHMLTQHGDKWAAKAIEAGTAATTKIDAVHESAVPQGFAQKEAP